MKKKLFNFIIIMPLLSSCFSSSVIGTYKTTNNGNFILKLNKDQTYSISYNIGLLNDTSSGKWKIYDKNNLVLNSNKKYGILEAFEMKEIDDSLKIFIKNIDNEPLFSVIEVLSKKDSIIVCTTSRVINEFIDKGCIHFKDEIKKITIKSVIGQVEYIPSKSFNNYFKFTVNLNELGYIYLTDEVVKIKRTFLIYKGKKLKRS